MEEAFRAAHSLKGICANLGFPVLGESSSVLTEYLRGKDAGQVDKGECAKLLEKVTEDYNTVLQNDNKIEENIEQKEDIYVEEHELINKEDVSINISNVVQDNKKTAFNFTIINESSKDYSVSAHTFSVNGVMAGANLYGFGSVDVPTGKKAKLSIEIENEWLKENEIDNIGILDVIFWSYYDGTKEWDSGKISVETNLYDENAVYVPKGEKIYSDDNIDVWKNDGLNFTILNKSEYNAGYTIENCSVNEWSYELTDYTYDLYDEDIHTGSYANFSIDVDEEFLEEIGTNNIDNIEFDILLKDSYWDLKGHPWEHKTEKIKVEL